MADRVLQLGVPKGSLQDATVELFRRSGWKIVIVAICVMVGTYMGSVVVADLFLRLGQ